MTTHKNRPGAERNTQKLIETFQAGVDFIRSLSNFSQSMRLTFVSKNFGDKIQKPGPGSSWIRN